MNNRKHGQGTHSPSQSAPTILKNRAPCFLKIGHPAFWKKQSAKNQGHCYSEKEEAVWCLLFLNREWPCFFQPNFCKKQGAPIFKMQGAQFLRIVGANSLAKKYPKCPKIYRPNLFAKAKTFWISMKKGIHNPCSIEFVKTLSNLLT